MDGLQPGAEPDERLVAALSPVERGTVAAKLRTGVSVDFDGHPAGELSRTDRQREELQLGHGKMLSVVGEERYFIAQGNGGNGHVGVRKRLAFLLPVAPQEPGVPCDFRGDRQVLQAVQKSRRPLLFIGPETGVHLREIYGATREDVPLLDELLKELGAAKPPVEVIENDR